MNGTEDFKEVNTSYKYGAYVAWVLAIIVSLWAAVQFSQLNDSLSRVYLDLTAGTLTTDNVSPLLSILSMEQSHAFGAIGMSAIFIALASIMYGTWLNINSKAHGEYLIRRAVEDIKEEIRSNRLNLGSSTTRQDKLPK